ncbi:hypothetical protein B6N85_004052 [Salmonella enterica subsp. diarizonae serovar 61:l,v:1,5,7]|nr:hypothetical protein [Salmonella enterica subsp. diarizonae serovar 61:l,v:1,5,7]
MKDDYHLPVITRLEREARRLGIKKAKLAMALGLNEREYNYVSDGWEDLNVSCLTSYVHSIFISMGIDLFILCVHRCVQRWIVPSVPGKIY